MKLEFTSSALARYNSIKESSPELADKIKQLLLDALKHPESGIGSPTPLAGELTSKWIRTFSLNGFVIYSFSSDRFKVELIETEVRTSTVKLEGFTKEEEDAVMSLMAANRGRDNSL